MYKVVEGKNLKVRKEIYKKYGNKKVENII